MVALIPVGAGFGMLRASSALATTTVWAEDGREFLTDAIHHGFAGSLLRPYNGYLHVPSRLVAFAASVDLPRAALILATLSCLVQSALAAFVYFASRGHIHQRTLRAVVAASVVLLPVAAGETLANAANLHWFFMFAAFWAVVSVAGGWPTRGLAATVVFFAMTSDPFPIVLAPLVLLRLKAALPAVERFLVPAVFFAAAAMQIFTVATAPRAVFPPSYLGAAKIFPLRVSLPTALGFDLPSQLFTRLGWLAAVAAAVAAVFLIVTLFLCGDRKSWHCVVAALAFGFGMFVLYAGMRWADGLLPVRGNSLFHTNSRYSVTPGLLLLSAVAILLGRLRHDRARKLMIGSFVLVLAPMWILDFRVETTRGQDPTWADSYNAAVMECRSGASRALIEVQPVSRPIPWAVDAPCESLVGNG
ncbi:MAG TPA: hypothetical protein VMZ22_10360 [Acidimicrobiales bacterium]|nr:hypothetical protein [Acidimicrobiales bacterium]